MFLVINRISVHLYSAFELLFAGVTRILLGINWLVESHGKAPAERDIESAHGALEGSQTGTQDQLTANARTAPSSSRFLELEYNPTVEETLSCGSTAIVGRLKPGIVLKYPRFSWWESPTNETYDVIQDIKRSFTVEEKILGILGPHPNIVRFLGPSQVPRGLLFVEANQGNLQTYLDNYNDKIDMPLRIRWRTQAAAATSYIHQKGVIHSDQRPENYLVHGNDSGDLNIYLADFGGSTCGEIDGGHLPDSGFFDPRNAWVSTEATDIFSLGSVFYAIMTGHWPYKSPGPFESVEEKCRYEEKVDALFLQGKFPTTEHILGSGIIQGCWTAEYQDAAAILRDQQVLSKTWCIHNNSG